MTDRPPRPKRSSVFIDAALDSATGDAPMQLVRVRDLSEGGAKVEGKAPPVGTRVILSRGVIEIAGRVAWAKERQFGVAFDEPTSIELLMRAAGRARSPERPLHAAALTSGVGAVSLPRRRPASLDRRTFGLRVATPR